MHRLGNRRMQPRGPPQQHDIARAFAGNQRAGQHGELAPGLVQDGIDQILREVAERASIERALQPLGF